MKVRQKILIAFVAILLVPGILMFVVGMLSFNGIEKKLGTVSGHASVLFEPIQAFTEITDSEYNELCVTADFYPERFTSDTRLKSINDALTKKYSYLAVMKGGESYFVGDAENFALYGEKILKAVEGSSEIPDGIVVSDDKFQMIVKMHEINFEDGDTGSCIIVTKVSEAAGEFITRAAVGIFVGFLVCLCGTALLYKWVDDSIIKPLDTLKVATRKIGSGDLNFTLKRDKQDEIGQLCSDFEEMRRHLKTQIDQTEHYEQDIREMISNVSHDLKTPLTTIKGYAEGLLDGVADSKEKRDKYLKTIVVKAGDMTLLVDELSYYSKLDNNKLPYKFEKVNAVGYFGDCAEEYKTELEMKDFDVSFVSEIDPATLVVIDCEQIRRVMNNIIGNSVKYRTNDIHGEIEIRLTDSGDSVRVSVTDNGIGISKEEQSHVFERFYRADKSRTSGRAGTGIGLAIVEKIIKEHKGRVFVKSEIGKGTTMSFTIKKGEQ